MELGLVSQFELMMQPIQELELLSVMKKVKEIQAMMMKLELKVESVTEPELEVELEKGPGLLFVKPP